MAEEYLGGWQTGPQLGKIVPLEPGTGIIGADIESILLGEEPEEIASPLEPGHLAQQPTLSQKQLEVLNDQIDKALQIGKYTPSRSGKVAVTCFDKMDDYKEITKWLNKTESEIRQIEILEDVKTKTPWPATGQLLHEITRLPMWRKQTRLTELEIKEEPSMVAPVRGPQAILGETFLQMEGLADVHRSHIANAELSVALLAAQYIVSEEADDDIVGDFADSIDAARISIMSQDWNKAKAALQGAKDSVAELAAEAVADCIISGGSI